MDKRRFRILSKPCYGDDPIITLEVADSDGWTVVGSCFDSITEAEDLARSMCAPTTVVKEFEL